MNTFSFIAADNQLPEVENLKVKTITVSEAIKLGMKSHASIPWGSIKPDDKIVIVKSEDDFDELEIKNIPEYDEEIGYYTKKPFIYSLDFKYTEQRGKELLDYLKENIKEGHELELWKVELEEQQNLQPKNYSIDEIALEDISEIYDHKHKKYEKYSCTIIKK